MHVVDVYWSSNSRELVSGSYDQTCRTWDVESGRQLGKYVCNGFVQCVQIFPGDNNIVAFGTSRCALGVIDRRMPNDCAVSCSASARINTLHVYYDRQHVLTGDNSGQISVWDIRKLTPLCVTVNERTRRPISHIAVLPRAAAHIYHGQASGGRGDIIERAASKAQTHKVAGTGSNEIGIGGGIGGGLETPFLATNSYDNIIRVYKRESCSALAVPEEIIHWLKGYKNKNLPIRSSFYAGAVFVTSSLRESTFNHTSLDPREGRFVYTNAGARSLREIARRRRVLFTIQFNRFNYYYFLVVEQF